MRLGYVVLYVEDPQACEDFWVRSLGAKVEEKNEAAGFHITKLALPGGGANLELVPKALMKDNPDGLDLATPSLCFYVDDANAEHARLSDLGLNLAPVREHFGRQSFAFSDNEGRWFAVMATR